MSVRIRLHGTLQNAVGKGSFQVKLAKPITLRELIKKLTESIAPKLREVLINPDLLDPRPNTLILVNGKEVSALEGLETRVQVGDEVVFIPVSHGG